MFCPDIFIQSDEASFAVLLLICHVILRRHNFAMQVHSDHLLIFACIQSCHLMTLN